MLGAPLSLVVVLAAGLWAAFFDGRSLGDLARPPGLMADRRILSEHALHSRVSFASPPHRHTGVLLVPQLVHFCSIEYRLSGRVKEIFF